MLNKLALSVQGSVVCLLILVLCMMTAWILLPNSAWGAVLVLLATALALMQTIVSVWTGRKAKRTISSMSELSADLERRIAEPTLELVNSSRQLLAISSVMSSVASLNTEAVVKTALETAARATSATGGSYLVEQDGVTRVLAAMGKPSRSQDDHQASSMIIPIRGKHEVLGRIVLHRDGTAPLPAQDQELIDAIGNAAGLAIEAVTSYEQARAQADRDALTGLYNHRAITALLDREVKRTLRTAQPLSVLMIDVDRFKIINDTYGHHTGDILLKSISSTLCNSLRETDLISRYGGDEFLLVLPETGMEGAVTAAERIRANLEAHPLRTPDGSDTPIRLSIGIATNPDDSRECNRLLAIADAHLYESKRKGGDTITYSDRDGSDPNCSLGAYSYLETLVSAVNRKDGYTLAHSEKVASAALALARRLGLSRESQRALRIAALLHDVGKIVVPTPILMKPDALSTSEREVVRQHVVMSEMMIMGVPVWDVHDGAGDGTKDIPIRLVTQAPRKQVQTGDGMLGLPQFREILAAVAGHHERWDGKGYPRGLAGESISLLARILAVADSYAAMSVDRPYRKALDDELIMEELLAAAGQQLDPKLATEFIEHLAESSREAVL